MSGSVYFHKGNWRAKISVPGGARPTLTLSGCSPSPEAEAEAIERADVLSKLAKRAVEAGYASKVKELLRDASAATPAQLKALLSAAAKLLAIAPPKKEERPPTFKEFALAWTSGKLHEKWPDHIKAKKSAAEDALRFDSYVNPLIGDIPITEFSLLHAEKVMAAIPPAKSVLTRRHVAQIMHRLAAIAVYPGKYLKTNPLPKGFLPPANGVKATAYLYPAEDAALLACVEIPLERRVLYGVLAREGMRYSEAVKLTHRDIDLDNGTLTLDENKTDDPRAWALGADVVRALKRWRDVWKPPSPFPIRQTNNEHQAEQFRADLRLAGVHRRVLFLKTESRLPIRVHDLRATFITLALALGKSETWVADRTGHRSSQQINNYRRQSRTASELGLGWLAPLDEAIPELSNGVSNGSNGPPWVGVIPGKRRRIRTTMHRIMDSKSSVLTGVRVQVSPSAQAVFNHPAPQPPPSLDTSLDTSSPEDPNAALARAIEVAATAGRWDAVVELGRLLQKMQAG